MNKPIDEMIEDNDTKGIEAALISDAGLVSANKGYDQYIHIAASDNKADIVELLLRYGADVNAKDEDGRTPLHRSAELGPETVKVLLTHGGDPNSHDKNGHSPMSWAISGQQREGEKVVEMLRAAGANYGLLEAVAMGDLETVKTILNNNKKAVQEYGHPETLFSMAWTVRQFGKPNDRERMVELLLQCGIILSKKTLTKHADASHTRGLNEIEKAIRSHIKSMK